MFDAVLPEGARTALATLAQSTILLDYFSLPELLDAYDKKFGVLASNQIHVLKGLVYFVDAEPDRHPDILIEGYEWETVKAKMTAAVQAL